MQGNLQVSFLNGYNVVANLQYESASSVTTQLVFAGAVSSHATAFINPVSGEATGVMVNLNTTLANNWHSSPSVLDLAVQITSSCNAVSIDISASTRSYNITVDIPANSKISCSFYVSFNNNNVNTTIADTTSTINSWLAEVNPPPAAMQTDAILIMYYQSWFNFWYNIEHAEGNWTNDVITPSKSTYGRGMWLWDSAVSLISF